MEFTAPTKEELWALAHEMEQSENVKVTKIVQGVIWTIRITEGTDVLMYLLRLQGDVIEPDNWLEVKLLPVGSGATYEIASPIPPARFRAMWHRAALAADEALAVGAYHLDKTGEIVAAAIGWLMSDEDDDALQLLLKKATGS